MTLLNHTRTRCANQDSSLRLYKNVREDGVEPVSDEEL